MNRLSAMLKSKTMEEYVKDATTSESGTEAHRKAVWNIRELAEKNKSIEQILRSGALKVIVGTLQSGTAEEKLWALFVMRMLAEVELSASMVLQEPNAIETLVAAVANSAVGSEHAKRSVETFRGLSQHLSTQILLARPDVYNCMCAAMNADVPEARAALQVYAALSEVDTGASLPPYAKPMATEKALSTLSEITVNRDFTAADRDLAKRVLAQLNAGDHETTE